jgi:transmembrane sensor
MININSPDNYNSSNDFLNDAGFINFHFKLDARDEFWWNNWILNNPGKSNLINEAKDILNMLSFTIPDDEYNTELQKIKEAISRKTNAEQNKGLFKLLKSAPVKHIAWRLTSAAVLILISAIYLVNYFISSDNDLKEHLNGTGKNLTVILEDATEVALSPGSRLQYGTFSSTERNVILQGSANFEVTKNKNAPFKVFAGKIVATVLGTSFDVKNDSDSMIIVDLKSGSLKVAVAHKGILAQEVLLEPNQRAVFSNFRLVKVVQPSEKNNEKATTGQNVEFNKNDFLQVADIMSKTFGIVLINESGINNWKFSGQFNNSTALEIIESICLIKGLTSSVKGDTIIIK